MRDKIKKVNYRRHKYKEYEKNKEQRIKEINNLNERFEQNNGIDQNLIRQNEARINRFFRTQYRK